MASTPADEPLLWTDEGAIQDGPNPALDAVTESQPCTCGLGALCEGSCVDRIWRTRVGERFGATRCAACCGQLMRRFIPASHWLPKYPWCRDGGAQLRDDVTTGLTVGVMLIPQGMAYASLAGLPPIFGLYSSLAPLLIYGLCGTSAHLHFGPFGLVSILIADGLGSVGFDAAACDALGSANATYVPLPATGNATAATSASAAGAAAAEQCSQFTEAAITLSLLVGLCHMCMAALRLDMLAEVLADPVMAGFTSAAAVIIATSQAPKLVGLHVPHGRPFFQLLFASDGLLFNCMHANVPTVILSVASLALLSVLTRVNKAYRAPPRIPIPVQLVLVVVAIVLSSSLGLHESYSIATLGAVPGGLPLPQPPALRHAGQLLRPALIIAFISFIINTSIVKVFSARFAYAERVCLQQELVATGLANFAGSFFHSFPCSGSLSRGAVVASVGGNKVSMMHNIVAAGAVGLALAVLTALIAPLPKAVLGAIIVHSIAKLINTAEPQRLFHARHFSDLALCLGAFVLTLVFGVQDGIILSICLSLLLLLRSTARPHAYCLGLLPDTDGKVFVDFDRYPGAAPEAGVMIFRFGASLHFANKDFFALMLAQSEARHNQIFRAAVQSRAAGFGGVPKLGASEGEREADGVHAIPIHREALDEAPEVMLPEVELSTYSRSWTGTGAAGTTGDDISGSATRQRSAAQRRVRSITASHAGRVHVVVMDCSSIHDIDSSSMRMLERLAQSLWDRGNDRAVCMTLLICSLTMHVRKQLLRDSMIMGQLKRFAQRDARLVHQHREEQRVGAAAATAAPGGNGGTTATSPVNGREIRSHNNLFVTIHEAVTFANQIVAAAMRE